jgi:selenocysteine lyase/cysteine desulfurase
MGVPQAFLQTIRVALSLQLKEKMGVHHIKNREEEINKLVFKTLESLSGVKVLAPNHKERLSIFSFYFEKYHFNLVVKLLNDRFGIQTRGGCSCAGTYGHFLLNVDQETSNKIQDQILHGCNTEKARLGSLIFTSNNNFRRVAVYLYFFRRVVHTY